MDIIYKNKRVNGQTLSQTTTSHRPTVVLRPSQRFYTLAMWDPDAPGASPSWLHWLVVNIPYGNVEEGNILVPYAPPTPPPGTGVHRYYFTLYEQSRRIPMTAAPQSRAGFHPPQWAAHHYARLLDAKVFQQKAS